MRSSAPPPRFPAVAGGNTGPSRGGRWGRRSNSDGRTTSRRSGSASRRTDRQPRGRPRAAGSWRPVSAPRARGAGGDLELVDAPHRHQRLEDRPQLPQLLGPMEAHELGRHGALGAPHGRPEVPQPHGQAVDDVRPLAHPVRDAEELPQRVVAEVVILLAIRKARRQLAALGGAEAAMVEKPALAIRARVPAPHAGGGDGDPVDAARAMRHVAADLPEALTPEQLALAGDVVLALEAVRIRAVAAVLLEDGAGHAQPRILGEAFEEKLQVILLERDVTVEIADDVVLELLDTRVAGVEGVHLGCEAPLLADRPVDDLDPRVPLGVSAGDRARAVGGAIVDNHPAQRQHRLAHDRFERFLDERFLVASRRDENVLHPAKKALM